ARHVLGSTCLRTGVPRAASVWSCVLAVGGCRLPTDQGREDCFPGVPVVSLSGGCCAGVAPELVGDEGGRRGARRTGAHVLALRGAGQKAERAFDRWSAQERGDARLRAGLALFTPQGERNTPQRGLAEVQAARAGLRGPAYAQGARAVGPEAFTLLRRAHARLAALPVPPALVRAGRRARPQALPGEGPPARARRG